uniref:Uncharacterized protein n=1 Tax=Arundo donax TaxID=35708 RepID=A0A0A9TA07_ARUDO
MVTTICRSESKSNKIVIPTGRRI